MPFFHGKVVHFIDTYMGDWDKKIPQPYHDELLVFVNTNLCSVIRDLQGIANATGLPLGEIVLYNLFYEIHSLCTSIVAKDENGKLHHGRNMDFGLFMGWNISTHEWVLTERLRGVTVNVVWLKDGKPLFRSVNFVGFVGVFNGMKPVCIIHYEYRGLFQQKM
jgi:acid ceramidase